MTLYKPHFACFACRKTFKRRLWIDIRKGNENSKEAKCPDCSQLMANMGMDFEAPKKNNIKAWQHIEELFSAGIAFHSCGCMGPGYIPNNRESLLSYFQELIEDYQKQLSFWRKRQEPTNEREAQREFSKNWDFIGNIPSADRKVGKNKFLKNETAINYWIGRIKEVEDKLKLVA